MSKRTYHVYSPTGELITTVREHPPRKVSKKRYRQQLRAAGVVCK